MTDDVITIDADRAIELLREVVKGNEQYVYQRKDTGRIQCTYERNGQPDCIIGRALCLAGVTVEQLQAMDRCDGTMILYEEPRECIPNVAFTEGALNIFGRAQSMQDGGARWGRVLLEAEEYYETLKGVADPNE